MTNNVKFVNKEKYHKYTQGNINQFHTPYYNTTPYVEDAYPPTSFQKHNIIHEISNKLPLTTSIISYNPIERSSAEDQPRTTSQNTFLDKIAKQFPISDVIDSKNLIIDNDTENKLSIPLDALNATYTYSTTTTTNNNIVKIPFDERFTPYKAKLYNDIIQVIANASKSFMLTQKILRGIVYIECSETKITLYIRTSVTNQFPFEDITKTIQNRLGDGIDIEFAPINTIGIVDYFIHNLYTETQCQPNQNYTNTNVAMVGTKSLTQ